MTTKIKVLSAVSAVVFIALFGSPFIVNTPRNTYQHQNRSYQTFDTTPRYPSSSYQTVSNTQGVWSGTDSRGRNVYRGSQGGEYYVSPTSQRREYYSRPEIRTERVIHTGPRGGEYYINSQGNKVYLRRK